MHKNHNFKTVNVKSVPKVLQAFGKRAKQFTSNMVYGKNVEVRPVTTDGYGRTIAWIYVGGTCVNEALLQAGLAWHYKRYSSERHLADLETKAKQGQVGLWSHPRPIAPWDFRHGKRMVTGQTQIDQETVASELLISRILT